MIIFHSRPRVTPFGLTSVCWGVGRLVGTFSPENTLLRRAGDTDTLSGLFFEVAVLTGEGNVLGNADGGTGCVGPTLTVPIPLASDHSDGLLEPGGSFDVEFVIGLAEQAPFEFFVDAFGVVQ